MKKNYNKELNKILTAFNNYYGFNIIEQTRKQEYFFARCVFFKIARTYSNVGLATLAEFSGITHASVINALNVFSYEIKKDSVIKKNYDKIMFLYADFFENNGAHTQDELFNSQVFLDKYEDLKNKNYLLELDLIKEKSKDKEIDYKHSFVELLNNLDYEVIDYIYKTRFIPYAKINKINIGL